MFRVTTVVSLFAGAFVAAAQEASITVHADQVTNSITRYLTGACIEDVNHEIYGGIYSQLIFGESFQEPPTPIPPKNFTAYAGNWKVDSDGSLSAGAGDGPKLLFNDAMLSDGEVSVDILFPDDARGNAGLILRVNDAHIGPDHWIGYEISFDASGRLVLGRHRNNWEPIKNVPLPTPLNQWMTLTVRLKGNTIEVLANGQSVLQYEDTAHPLRPGKIGLRTWQRTARFRSLRLRTADMDQLIPFQPAADQDQSAGVSGMWRPIRRGEAKGSLSTDTDHPFTGSQSQRITFTEGAGEIGVENAGLNRWGISLIAGKPYEGYVWLRASDAIPLYAALESADRSKVYAESKLDPKSKADWQRLDFTLTPSANDANARFALKLKQSGSLAVGHAFLQPGEWGRFKGLPVRKDVADALVAQGLTVLRYGGSMVNAEEYRWKKMIGPRDRRPPYHGTWYPHSSNGWAIPDFLNFCEAAGFLAIPDLNVNESPQDIADLIEYLNGPEDSEWGRRRAADGHPEPYHLKYIELGNEEAVNDAYWKKFKPLAEAIWAKDPGVTPIVGDFAYGEHITDPYNFKGAPNITSLSAQKQILDFAAANHKPVWFDVHIGNDRPRDPDKQIVVLGEFIDHLAKLSPNADYKVCVFEENANNHLVRRAIAHARTITSLQRLGAKLPILCCANCLQCDGQNDNGWDQGLLFLNPSKVWGQPSYFITQMISRNYQPNVVKTDVESADNSLSATTLAGPEGLSIQVVNVSADPLRAHLKLEGVPKTFASRHLEQLTGPLTARNTVEDPQRITPSVSPLPPGEIDDDYTFPANSFTILRFK